MFDVDAVVPTASMVTCECSTVYHHTYILYYYVVPNPNENKQQRSAAKLISIAGSRLAEI